MGWRKSALAAAHPLAKRDQGPLGSASVSASEPSSSPFPLRQPGGAPIVSGRFLRRARLLAEAIFASHAGPPPRQRLDWLMLEAEDYLARGGAQIRFTLGLAAFAVCVLAPLWSWRLRSLASLEVNARVAALERLEASPLAAPLLAVKAMLCVLYYEHPDAAREVGFEPTCLTGPRSPAAHASAGVGS